MARSRYAGLETIDGKYLATWRNRALDDQNDDDMLAGLVTVEHVVSVGERLDHIANRYYGDASYYWIIALCNNILFPLSVAAGTKLRVPIDLVTIMNRLHR